MNSIELSHKIRKQHESELAMLAKMPEAVNISFLNNNVVFFEDAAYGKNMATLHELRKVWPDLKLNSYYINCGRLVLCYFQEGLEWSMSLFCTDNEYTLEKVSKGKCSIVTEEHTIKEENVICEL